MKALLKIAFRNLVRNKRWSIPTGIAILITVSLLSGLGTVVSTYLMSSQQAIIEAEGPSHLIAFNMEQNQIEELYSSEDVRALDVFPVVSYAKITNYTILNTQSPYAKLMHMDQESFHQHSFRLVDGSYPMLENEIALNEAFLYFTDLDLKVGDKIRLDYGTRIVDNQENKSRIYNMEYEEFEMSESKEFTITGFLITQNIEIGDFKDAGFISIVSPEKTKDDQNIIMIQLDAPNQRSLLTIENFLNKESIDYEKTTLMTTFYTGADAFKDSPLYFMVFGGLLLGFLILIASILVIRNAYAINQRYIVRQLGYLDAIGATQIQKLALLITQSLIFSIICIPLGLMIGYMSATLLLMYFRNALSEVVFYSRVIIYFDFQLILFIITLCLIVILFTSIVPALKISSLSSIESIKYYDREIEKHGFVMPPPFLKKIESRLAFINYRRGRVYYRSLTLSLIISIVLIGTSVIMVNSNQRSQEYSRKDIIYQYDNQVIEDGRLNEIVTQLKQSTYTTHAGLWSSYYLTLENITPSVNQELSDVLLSETHHLTVNVVDDDYCLNVLQNEFEGFDCTESGLFNDYFITTYLGENNEVQRIEGALYDAGIKEIIVSLHDTQFSLNFDDTSFVYGSDKAEVVPTIYFSRSMFNRVSSPFINHLKIAGGTTINNTNEIFINSESNTEALTLFRTTLSQNGIEDLQNIVNVKNTNFLIVQLSRFIGILSFSLVALIVIIAISNVVNSVNHSLNVRAKETSILISNGLTMSSFVKIIVMESLMFGGVAMLIGIPVAMVLSYVVSSVLSVQVASYLSQWLLLIGISVLLVIIMMALAITLNVITIRNHTITELTHE
ncbi:MAG TPA: ABC transporter permease [Erysipelothrix sp.]|nr:ABC transporter permease [Erysipelothrix sp.]